VKLLLVVTSVCACVCVCVIEGTVCLSVSLSRKSIYNNRIVKMATGRGRHARVASSERGQTTCADRLRAPATGEGAAWCVAYEACGYKQVRQTDGREDVQAEGLNRANSYFSNEMTFEHDIWHLYLM